MPLLEVQNLKVHFPVRHRQLGQPRAWVKAVDDVTFTLEPGETLGLVGESGCGKTTLGRAIVGLRQPTSGHILFHPQEGKAAPAAPAAAAGQRCPMSARARARQRQMIFQDPYGSLDPRMTVENIIGEALDIHGLARNRPERAQKIAALLKAVGLEPSFGRRYPHQFSGGQRQRIGIARALAVEPELIVCDEPVSALDVSVQAQIINLLQELQLQRRIAYLFIAHDLAVVEHISHRVMVMYLGKIVETAPAQALVADPKHPYTQALISAVPTTDPDTGRQRIVLPGELPSPINPPPGCPFHERCPIAEPRCRIEPPQLRQLAPGHYAACHLAK